MKQFLSAITILTAVFMTAQDFKINNRIPETGFSCAGSTWKYEHNTTFDKGKVPGAYLVPENRIKIHKKHSYIRGYNGDLNIQIHAPGPVKTLEWTAEMTNYADSMKRSAGMSYSIDGYTFKTLDSKEFGSDVKLSSGKITLPANDGVIFLKLQRHVEKKDANGRHGFVLWKKMNLKITGETGKNQKAPEPISLKKVFPTGVFWAWERTKMNADFAKMDMWDFVDYTMKVLKGNGYNTCWFVNISSNDDQLKILQHAEKHGLQVLTNGDLIHSFYGTRTSLDQLDIYADQTVSRIGRSKSLLGYVLKDEPLMCDLDTCGYYYELMKKADPIRDSVAVVMNRQSLSYLRDSKLPVVCTDIYYFSDDNSTMLPSPRKEAQDEFTNVLNLLNESAERHNKHSWFMGQIFGDIWGRHWYKDGKYIAYPGCYLHWRMPTEAEARWQVWEALRLGTKGVFIYVLHSDIPLMVPPEKASTPEEKKKVDYMDKRAKTVAGWKNQKLLDKKTELDWAAGMLHTGGKPTKQMLATAPVMKLIRANESLLVKRKRADFPVLFSSDESTNVATFRSGERWLGVVVNRDVNQNRTMDILLAANVKSIRDIASGKELNVSTVDKYFKKITLSLEAGSGALLDITFCNHPGIRYAKESFDHQSIFRTLVNLNAEIFHHGNFAADENRSLRLKKDGNPKEAVCALLGISNPKTAITTFSKNVNLAADGITYCLINGKLAQAEIRAVKTGMKGEQANFAHLRIPRTGKIAPMDGVSIKKDKFHIPAVVPNDTTALEFYLGKKDYLEDITVWFVPNPPTTK